MKTRGKSQGNQPPTGVRKRTGLSALEVLMAALLLAFLFIPLLITRSTEQQRVELLREDIFVTGLIEDCAAALADTPNSVNLMKFLVPDKGGFRLELPPEVHPRLLRYPQLHKGWVEPAFEKQYVSLYARTNLRFSAIFKGGGGTLHVLTCRFDWKDSHGRPKSRTINRLVVGLLDAKFVGVAKKFRRVAPLMPVK